MEQTLSLQVRNEVDVIIDRHEMRQVNIKEDVAVKQEKKL